MTAYPGHEGSVGPFPGQYGQPHVYARDVHSGAGNCVCGRDPRHARLHPELAPGVPNPEYQPPGDPSVVSADYRARLEAEYGDPSR